MPSSYTYALINLDLATTNISKTVGTNPYSAIQFQTNDGIRYIATVDFSSNIVSIFQISGTDGNLQSQATITSNSLITKPVGTSPFSVTQFQANDGTRYIVTADFNSNRVSIFQISGTDGNLLSKATIEGAGNELITKTTGSQPASVIQFQASNGTRYIATADFNSNRVSIFQISGTDGNLLSKATIEGAGNALITKTTGSNTRSLTQFQTNDGIRYIATVDFASNRVSIFQISGTDGNLQSQATITSNSLITKPVGTNPVQVIQFQASNGTRYIATVDFNSNRVSIFQISGTDGNLQSQATITSNPLITKTVGTNPFSGTQFQANNGTRYIATADLNSNRVSIFQISGTDGNLQSQATITSNSTITKTTGSNPRSVTQFQANDGTRYIVTADGSSSIVSIFQISNANEISLRPGELINVVVDSTSSFLTGVNLAELTFSVNYFNFAAGISSNRLFAPSFNYSYDENDRGTLGNGATLRLTTNTADITNSGGLTIASGATVRLGLKTSYTIQMFFQNGSTLEVFPNSSRGNATLDLSNFTFAATTTINATSGTATVAVSSVSAGNISAGAGVTIQVPQPTITFTGLPAGGIFTIWDDEIADPQDLGTALQTTNPTTGANITYVAVAGNAVVYQFVPDSGDSANYQEFNISAFIPAASQTVDFTANLEREVNI